MSETGMHPAAVEEVAVEEAAVLDVVRPRGRARARVHAPGTVNGGDELPAHLLVREAGTMAGEARPHGGHVRDPAREIGVVEGEGAVVPGPRRPRPRPGLARGVEAGRPPGGGARRSRVRRTGEKVAMV